MSGSPPSLVSQIASGAPLTLPTSYDYASKIPSTSAMGISTNGDVSSTMNDISGTLGYISYLVEGPNLGNAFFLNSGASCTDSSGNVVDRYSYISNESNQSFVPGFQGFGTTGLDGLLPGLVAQVENLNPLTLFTALTADALPACKKVSCTVGDAAGAQSQETAWVSAQEHDSLVSNGNCQEGFTSAAAAFDPDCSNDVGGHVPTWALLGLPIAIFALISLVR